MILHAIDHLRRRWISHRYWREPCWSEWYRREKDYEYQTFINEARWAKLTPKNEHSFTGAADTDYLLLSRYIAMRRPAHVLELGGGLTTYVIAKAMKEGGAGQLWSVDHVQRYSSQTESVLWANMLRDVRFSVSPTTFNTIYAGVSAVRYRELPKGPFDMIYVDGPPSTVGKEQFPCVDALLALGDEPTDIIIDGRLPTVNYFSLWLSCTVWYDPILGVGFVRGATATDVIDKPNSWAKPRARLGDARSLFSTKELKP